MSGGTFDWTILLGIALLSCAFLAAYLPSFFLYGLAMYGLGFLAGLYFINQDEEQDDDNS